MHSSPFSYLLLPLNSLCIAFSLSFSGVSSVLSQLFIKKTKQRVYSNVEVALQIVFTSRPRSYNYELFIRARICDVPASSFAFE